MSVTPIIVGVVVIISAIALVAYAVTKSNKTEEPKSLKPLTPKENLYKITELNYTENELAAIEALKRNKGLPLTADELGIKGVTVVGLMVKADKVVRGELSNPNNLPVFNISKDKVKREVTVTKECTTYCIK